MGDERKLLLSIRERFNPVLVDLLKFLKPFEKPFKRDDGESIFKFVTGKSDSAFILGEEVKVKVPDGKSTPYVFFHFLNSQKIPEDLLKKLGEIEEMRQLANRLGISVDYLIYYAFQESNQQMATIACDSNGRIVGVYGIILAQLDDIRMLYRNASVSLPEASGVYGTHVLTMIQKLPVNVFGASTNEEKLPSKWTKWAEEGFGREEEEPWMAFPRLDDKGNLITLPPPLAQKIEKMRQIPGLNMISGTPPDYEKGAIRFDQKAGIKRQTKNRLYEALKQYGFDPSRRDQILFIAVSPQVLNQLN
jgi:hypothetical protein